MLILLLIFGIALGTGSPSSAWHGESPPERSETREALDDKGSGIPEEVGLPKQLERLLSDLWWNQPEVIAALELTEEQRQRMDGRFTEYRLAMLRERRLPKAEDPFRAALEQGDLEGARDALVGISQKAAVLAVAEGEMVIDVLACLTSAQLEELQQSFPRALRHRWFIERGGKERRPGARKRGAMRGGAPPPSVDPGKGMK